MILERLFLYFIEGFWMVGAGLGFIGIRLNKIRMLSIAAIYGLFVHGVRTLYIHYSIPFGTHTFVLTTLFALLLFLVGKQKVQNSMIASLASVLLIYLGENIVFISFLNIIKIDIVPLLSKIGGTLLVGTLIDILLIIVFVVCYIFETPLIKIADFETTEKCR